MSGAAFPLSSGGGAVWRSNSLGRGAFTPARFGLVLFFWEPASPKRVGGRQYDHDQKEEEAKLSTREEAEESRTTEREEEGSPLNLTKLNFS